jgi:hypothetical protein
MQKIREFKILYLQDTFLFCSNIGQMIDYIDRYI